MTRCKCCLPPGAQVILLAPTNAAFARLLNATNITSAAALPVDLAQTVLLYHGACTHGACLPAWTWDAPGGAEHAPPDRMSVATRAPPYHHHLCAAQ